MKAEGCGRRTVMRAAILVLWAGAAKARTLEADFEDVGVAAGAYWNGNNLSGGVRSAWAHFRNSCDTNGWSWSGFAISSVNDTRTAGHANRYAVWTPGAGLGHTGSYAVVRDSAWEEEDVVTFPFPVRVQGFYVNNTTFAALAMRDGDALAKKFGGATGDDPDWFRLTITGRNRDGDLVETAETFYLADFRFTNNALDYIVGEWTWVDLTALGPHVTTLHFALSSSDNDPLHGMNTPPFFAMDGLRFVPSFSGPVADTHACDSPVPGFVGPSGDGHSEGVGNDVNTLFAGWASDVMDYSPAPDVATQWSDPAKALGPVTGNSMDIVSLGDLTRAQIDAGSPPGQITLRMSTPIANEEGPDFAVFENGIVLWGTDTVFGELGHVEVSSDGTNFARFPSVSLTTNPVGPYAGFDARNVFNLAGKHANAYGASWGTPFDLDDLASHPTVSNGLLDLADIRYVRVVDIPGSGDFFDSLSPSNRIYDAWHTFGSGGLDLEAVGVINSPEFARITTTAVGPGTIAPRGTPGGVVAVAHGSNATFQICPEPGHYFGDVLVNGHSQGAVSNYTFTSVRSNQTLTALFGSRIEIRSPYGTATPDVGIHVGYGPLTATLSGSPVTRGTTQYVCVGWAVSGSAPDFGSGTTAAFNLTDHSALSWLWTTNYLLSIETVGAGSVNRDSGWHAAGEEVAATATPDPYYRFTGWSGDVHGGTHSASVTVTMDSPRILTAHFDADLAIHGVPVAWLVAHGLTNGTPDEAAMSDRFGKSMRAWEEFYAGTDPNDPNSVFAIVASGVSGGSNYVIWTGGANGSMRPFAVLGSHDLAGGWNVLDGHATRSPDGTNVWWGAHSPSNVFHRIRVDTGQ